jgi:shikimate kinase
MAVRAVFLVGFMASGKSSVGQELARCLGWDFVDLDARIEAREQQSIAEIFRQRGEPAFRRLETSALGDLLSASQPVNTVVALGGGAFVQEKNRALLQDSLTIFLEAPVPELWQRSLTDGIERPLRRDPDQFAKLYADRLPFYRQAKVTIVTSGKSPTAICNEIQRNLQSWGEPETARSSPTPPSHSETGESK